MTTELETYTISELARLCDCSKQTIEKHLINKGLTNTYTSKNGKQVKAYELDTTQLQAIKQTVEHNKGISNTVNNPLHAPTNEWLDKYIEVKGKYDALNGQQKLLEDRQADYLQERKELNHTIQEQSEQIGMLKATLQANDNQIRQKDKIIKCLIAGLGFFMLILAVRLILLA